MRAATPLAVPDDCLCMWSPRIIKETGQFAYMEHKFAHKECPYHGHLVVGIS